MGKINDDKSRNYKYDGGYERNVYISEWKCEDQRVMARPASWRRLS